MKKVRMLENCYPYQTVDEHGNRSRRFRLEKGKEYTLTESEIKPLLKRHVRFLSEYSAKFEWYHVAEIVEDFGLHFGQSKHFYVEGGKSKVFGEE